MFSGSVADTRRMLREWKRVKKPKFVPCDMEVLDTETPTAGSRTTDFYLSSLAARHGMKLATLHASIGHKSVFLIPP